MPHRYLDHYDPNTEQTTVCEAKYVSRFGMDDPFITALPQPREPKELQADINIIPTLPPPDEFSKLRHSEQKDAIRLLSRFRICLPYYDTIEKAVDNALVNSYIRRYNTPSKMEYTYQDTPSACYTCSEVKGLGNAPTGFAVLGQSGCGKSTGIQRVLRKYPACIIHNPGTFQQRIQIPIIAVEMQRNSNFHGLYEDIGAAIDRAVGNTTRTYQTRLGRKGDNLSVKFRKLCELIQVFNIGLLIIDEIELIDTAHTKEGTLETFMSLSNQTGIAVGVVGTEDAYEKLFFKPRAARRLSPLINADRYCSNIKQIISILKMLYCYLPDYELDENCIEAYYQESRGIIDYILKIFMEIAIRIVDRKQKGRSVKITPDLIKSVAKTVIGGQTDVAHQIIVQDEELAMETMRMLHGKKKPTIANAVTCTIQSIFNDTYSEKQIGSALNKAMKVTGLQDDIPQLVAETVKLLVEREKNASDTKRTTPR